MCEIKKNNEINTRILILLFFKRTENSKIKVEEIVFRPVLKRDCKDQ